MTPDRPATEPAPPRASTVLIGLAALLAMVTLVYRPMLGSGFLFDDFVNLVDNRALHVTGLKFADWVAASLSSTSSSLARPLAMLSFAMNHYFTGLDPWAMKATNLAVHLLNTALVFVLARAIAQRTVGESNARRWLPWFAAAAWGLMPINETVVLLTVQRMESLAQTFVLLGLISYLAGRARQLQGRSGWTLILWGLAGSTALGVLCKESAALLPLYALAAEVLLFGFRDAKGGRDRKLIATYAFLLVLPAIGGLLWIAPQVLTAKAFGAREFSMGERVLTEWRVLVAYLVWTVAPRLADLSLYHDTLSISRSLLSPPSTIASGFALLALAGVGVAVRERRPLLALGIAWFFSAHLLTATVIPLELVFEHRNYFASIGVVFAMGDLLLVAPADTRWRSAGIGVALVACLFYASTSWIRAQQWRDPLSFAISEARGRPDSPRATYELARALIIFGGYRPDPRLDEETLAALAKARAADRQGILAEQASLIYAARTHRPTLAEHWTTIQARLASHPIGPEELASLAALTNCAVSRDCDFPPRAMLDTYGAALQAGDNAEVLNLYASYATRVMHDFSLAERLWRGSIEIRPREPQYRANLVRLLIALGRTEDARREIAGLRALGGLGRTRAMADELETHLPPPATPSLPGPGLPK